MARLAVAHTRAVTKGPPHRREGWKIRVGSFDSPPLTNGIGKLLYPTVNQDAEVIAGLVAIPEAAVHKFCPDGAFLGIYLVKLPLSGLRARIAYGQRDG